MTINTRKRLSFILRLALLCNGVVFLILSICTEQNDTVYLSIALGSIVLANFWGILETRARRKDASAQQNGREHR